MGIHGITALGYTGSVRPSLRISGRYCLRDAQDIYHRELRIGPEQGNLDKHYREGKYCAGLESHTELRDK